MSSFASSSGSILVRVTQGGRTKRYVSFVASQLAADAKDDMVVVVHAAGRACVKAITVAEVVKTLVPGLHQITNIGIVGDVNDPAKGSSELSESDVGSSSAGSDGDDEREEEEEEGTSESMSVEGEQALGRARVAIALSLGQLDERSVGYQRPAGSSSKS